MKANRAFRSNDDAFIDTKGIATVAGFVLLAPIVAVIALQILSSLIPVYAPAVKNVTTNLTTQDWGSGTANAIAQPFGILVPVAGILSLVGLVLGAFVVYRHRGG